MSKVSIASVDEAPLVSLPKGCDGEATARAVFEAPEAPIHLHAIDLAEGAALRIGARETDTVLYVWKGAVAAGGQRLGAGSSVIVERGAASELRSLDETTKLLSFAGARPPAEPRAGGHVHLLPAERAPRGGLPNTNGVSGALHADGGCPTCAVWLHENVLAPREDSTPPPGNVHSHTEDEVIFILDGVMHLGTRQLRAGEALAIAADAFYGFGVGGEGLTFINFRAAQPGLITLKQGGTLDEVALWRDNVGRPNYLDALTT